MIRRQRAGWWLCGLAVALVAPACGAPPPPPPPPAPMPVPDGPEVASDGNASVTVLGSDGQPAGKLPNPVAAGSAAPSAPQAVVTDESCRNEPACTAGGSCSAKDGACVAASWEDCERITACATGRCRFAEGRCETLAVCEQSHACLEEGRCRNGSDGRCLADACGKGPACKNNGLCGVSNGACVARNDRDCKLASVCKDGGRCLARGGDCVKSCQESKGCKRNGRCDERKGKRGDPASCIATSDKQCEASERCVDMGLCTLGLKGDCVAGDDVECLRSRACQQHGRCSAKQERCVPGSNAECSKSSIACKAEGRCRFQDGRCVK